MQSVTSATGSCEQNESSLQSITRAQRSTATPVINCWLLCGSMCISMERNLHRLLSRWAWCDVLCLSGRHAVDINCPVSLLALSIFRMPVVIVCIWAVRCARSVWIMTPRRDIFPRCRIRCLTRNTVRLQYMSKSSSKMYASHNEKYRNYVNILKNNSPMSWVPTASAHTLLKCKIWVAFK